MANKDNFPQEFPCFAFDFGIFKDISNKTSTSTKTTTDEFKSSHEQQDVPQCNRDENEAVTNDSQELEEFITAQKSTNTVKKTSPT